MSCITIDKTRCKACYLCIEVCPQKLIHKSSETTENGEYLVEFKDDNSKCLGCKQCAMVCPDIAIVKVEK